MIGRARRFAAIVSVCLGLFLTVSGTAFAAGVIHPRLDASDHSTITSGCTTINVRGHNFTPSTLTTTNMAFFMVVASTDNTATGHVILPVDARGRVVGLFQVCGITVSPEAIQIVAEDGPNGFYTNTPITIAK